MCWGPSGEWWDVGDLGEAWIGDKGSALEDGTACEELEVLIVSGDIGCCCWWCRGPGCAQALRGGTYVLSQVSAC